MIVILSGGDAGGQTVECADDADVIEVGVLLYKVQPPDRKNPGAPRVAVFAGDKEG